MEIFDNERNLKFILEEIKKADTFYMLFKKEFSELTYTSIHQFYPEIRPCEEIDELLEAYAVAILNATESVIDKDRNYPLYRLEEELGTMNRLTLKLQKLEKNSDFREAVHLHAKELMVKYFVAIYDLSSTGFRLLEKNAKLYNWEFISNFESILESHASIS
ncbi:MAG: hypothetical protein JZU47_21325 [Prolixibacteraceae bacterium]|nr:hypothetical protein [Prolixibacteraceae bacterium]